MLAHEALHPFHGRLLVVIQTLLKRYSQHGGEGISISVPFPADCRIVACMLLQSAVGTAQSFLRVRVRGMH